MNLETKIIKLERGVKELTIQQEKINADIERIINLHEQILLAIQTASAKIDKRDKR